ncbi:MAG: hypothetical protein HYW26_02805 [Candidatus Aenigmarchaeota archaeon]|nr:hypothetical protein [Candidatus Aenigmarchaeota archaeon]
MTLILRINGHNVAIAPGAPYPTGAFPPAGVVLPAGEQELDFYCEVQTGGPGAIPAGYGGNWFFNFFSVDDGISINPNPETPRPTNAVKFKAKLKPGAHQILVRVQGSLRLPAGYPPVEYVMLTITIPPPITTLTVKIKSPENNSNVVLKRTPAGLPYHDPLNFQCEIKGGRSPYIVRWFSYSESNFNVYTVSKILVHEETTKSGSVSFSRGGEEYPVPAKTLPPPPALPPPFPPPPDPKIPFSLLEGRHTISVNVVDSTAPAPITVGDMVNITVSTEPKKAGDILPGGDESLGGAARGREGMGLAGLPGIRKRLGKEVGRLDWSKRAANPALRSAINRGKKLLDQATNAAYYRLFDGPGGVQQRQQRRIRELEDARKDYEASMNSLRKYFRKYKIKAGVPLLVTARMASAQDLTNIANTIAQEQPALQAQMQEHQNAIKRYLELRDKFDETSENEIDKAGKELQEYAKQRAGTFATRLGYQYGFPANPPDERNALKTELEQYAVDIAEEFLRRGRSKFFAAARFMRRVGLGTETIAESYYNVIRSLWDLITGPWTIAWLFVVAQFYFSLSYIGYQPTLLFTMPAGGAVMMFLMNFSQIKRPLDGVTHAGVGALLGQGIIIFMFALGITPNLWGWGWFVGIWFIFGTIGAFEFYPVGGPQIMFQTAVLVIIFGYIALGPYKGYWELVKDQLRAPLYTMYVSMKNAVNDVWLLATNPTAWYAKQQVINVRPEQPISFPVEIETPVFEGLPPSAPAGTAFSVSIVTKNSGKLDAKNIVIEHACNEWCENRGAIVPDAYPLLHPGESQAFFMQKFAAKKATGREAEFRRARVFFNISYVYQTNSSLRVQVISEDELKRKFRDREDVFKPELATDKATSVKFSLNVGPQPIVYNDKKQDGSAFPSEKERQDANKGQLLVSVSNRRPDGLIILKSEKKSNGVITQRGNVVIIHFPGSVGNGLNCNGQDARTTRAMDGPPEDKDRYRNMANEDAKNGKELVVYKIPKDIEMKPFEFQTTFALLCEFNLAKVDTLRTDYVIAELPEYTFRLQKTLDVPVTPPIGILFDPDEDTCLSKCAAGIGVPCIETRCTSASNPDSSDQYLRRLYNDPNTPRCWYDPVGGNIENPSASDIPGQYIGSALTFNKCRSCGAFRGDTACEVFYNKQLCDEQGSKQCNLKCKWTPIEELKKKTAQPTQQEILHDGKCEKMPEAPAQPTTPAAPATGTVGPVSAGASKEQVVARIADVSKATGFSQTDVEWILKLVMTESTLAHCWDGTNSCGEDSKNSVKCGDNGNSCGLFQLNKAAHPQWYNPSTAGCDGKTAYDIDCNIRVGVSHLRSLYNSYYNNAPRTYACKGIQYSGWEAVLRYYNGWPPSGSSACSGDPNYVNNVESKTIPDSYLNIIASVYQGTQFGGPNYCSSLPSRAAGAKCQIGEGGCKSTSECEEVRQEVLINGEVKVLTPDCRDPGAGIKLCCYSKVEGFDSDAHCINKYNQKKSE